MSEQAVSSARQLHVLVCGLLNLDDEDHADDEAAEPLEKAINLYARNMAIQELIKLKTNTLTLLPGAKFIHEEAVVFASRLSSVIDNRITALENEGKSDG